MGTSNGRITNLKQSILEAFNTYGYNTFGWKGLPETNTMSTSIKKIPVHGKNYWDY